MAPVSVAFQYSHQSAASSITLELLFPEFVLDLFDALSLQIQAHFS